MHIIFFSKTDFLYCLLILSLFPANISGFQYAFFDQLSHRSSDLDQLVLLANKHCSIGSAVLSETVPPCIADKWTIPSAGDHACSCLLVYCSCWACALCNNALVYCYCRKASQSDAEGGTGALDLHRLTANWNIFADQGVAERMRAKDILFRGGKSRIGSVLFVIEFR